MGDDIGHPDGGLVAQLRDGAKGHVTRGEPLGIDGQLNGAGTELLQQFIRASGHEPLEVGLALAGLALFLVRLHVPGIDVKLPPVSTGGIRQAHGDGGPVLALACALHHSNVGVVAVAKGPRGLLKVAPLGGKTVVWVSGGPVDLEQQLLVCVLSRKPHPEAQITSRTDGHQVVHDAAAGGLCSVGGVEAHSSTQLQLGPWLHGTDQSAHGGFGVLILHDAGTGPLGEDPRPREAGDHQIAVGVLVAPVADAHGHIAVTAAQPADLPEKSEVLLGGAHLQRELALGVVGLVPVKAHPHLHPAQPGEGQLIQNVQRHEITSGRMPETMG